MRPWNSSQDCKNILIEDVDMIWNNRGGMYTHNIIKGHENVTLRRVRMNHNGHQGMQFQKTRNILAEDCETSYNSWRHYWANTISGWYQGGFKFMNTRTSTFIRHKAVENYGTGMWWDIDNKDITARDCYMDGNYCRGMFIEYNQGPSLVKNCTIINTKKSPIIADRNQGGLNFSCTKDVTVEGCTIKNNILGQLHVWYGARRGDGRDYETGQTIGAWDVANFKFRDNVIECGNDPTQTIVDLPNWSYLLNSWDSDSATYRHSSRFNAFFIYQNASYTFEGWQQLINGDTHSTFNQYAVPTNLTVTSVAKRAASISWTDNADNETGYVIERATGSGMSFTVLDTVAAGVTAYQSFSLQPGTAYAFRVRGLNTGNNSYSNTATVTILPLGTGLRADYRDKWGGHVSRTDTTINFNWGEGSPAPGIGTDHFTVAWSGQIDADYPENYTFYTSTDDGVRLWVDGKLLIDNWQENHKGKENKGTIFLQAGQKYDIRMEYYEHAAGASQSVLVFPKCSQAGSSWRKPLSGRS